MDSTVNKTDSWHSPVPVLSPGCGPIVNPNDSDFEDPRERSIATSASTTSNAHIPDQDVQGVTTSTGRIDVHKNSASFRVDEFEFEDDSNSDPTDLILGSETGDTIESFEDVEDIQSASATVFDDFDITSECGSSSSFSDCGFVLSVQDKGLESDSDENDSEAEMSESNPETDTIVISDDTQRHEDPLVRTLSTLVDDKELPGHGGIDDFDDDEEDAVEVEEVHKALLTPTTLCKRPSYANPKFFTTSR
ncbi:hypothetical protein VKT23_008587 [Stygiomarasmius scandens]|uniref:Uncharacterized protein n=1 Tax=Marasmiellus scandens TaxID=2682957 RepID=A0ABR1JMZ0_9AGAR